MKVVDGRDPCLHSTPALNWSEMPERERTYDARA